MKLPSKIQVGWKVYTVIDWNHETAEAAGRFGQADHNQAKISVDTHYGPRQSCETMMHEMLHCAFNVGSFAPYTGAHDEIKTTEETIVDFFGTWLTTIFSQNPELVGFVADCMRDGDAP